MRISRGIKKKIELSNLLSYRDSDYRDSTVLHNIILILSLLFSFTKYCTTAGIIIIIYYNIT